MYATNLLRPATSCFHTKTTEISRSARVAIYSSEEDQVTREKMVCSSENVDIDEISKTT
jgi:hypothetical protein